ncbi:MAG: rhomboid family intramembrane serine protease [Candidatus Caenarcaniphilales bacterium]|nr:rhomboid family intramembrane serine protease [Candidatus Caenarcaniphilales bacterium]
MLEKQEKGSIGCPSCGQWVSISASKCEHCGHPNPGFFGYYRYLKMLDGDQFANALLYICGGIYVLSLLIDYSHIRWGLNFGFLGPSNKSLLLLGSGGAIPTILEGSWWTVFTAPLLHASIFHIAFNLMWVAQLAPMVHKFYGFSKLIILYILSGVIGAIATALAGVYLTGFLKGSQLSIGASGAVFGLMGALIVCGQQSGSKVLKDTVWQYAIVGFVYGFIMPNVDNWAHFGGFIGGFLLPRIGWLSYKQKETVSHYIFAVILILASVAALAASVWKGIYVWHLFG